MKTKNCLALALTSALAIGCAAARAQDQGGPPPQPGPPPDGRGPDGRGPDGPAPDGRRPGRGQRPSVDTLLDTRRVMAIEERIRDAEARLLQLTAVEKKTDQHPDVMAVRQMVEELRRARDAVLDARRADEELSRRILGPGGAPTPDDLRRAELGAGSMRRRELRSEGGRPGNGPSTEQRLEQLERAVREMHDMFERHGVPPEMRERAEREMHERMAGGPPPGEPARPRPDVMGPGGAPSPEDLRAPRPPAPRRPEFGPATPRPEMSDVQKAMEEAHAQVEAMRRRLEEVQATMKRQLEEAQAALKQAQAQIEVLKARAPK